MPPKDKKPKIINLPAHRSPVKNNPHQHSQLPTHPTSKNPNPLKIHLALHHLRRNQQLQRYISDIKPYYWQARPENKI